ncbi:hypothetical protein B0H11DRAFT_1941982 [Mycena galericulata]|nr:hypothetical protein B0H11DRAFT_1941982 [Mycena galericulata]
MFPRGLGSIPAATRAPDAVGVVKQPAGIPPSPRRVTSRIARREPPSHGDNDPGEQVEGGNVPIDAAVSDISLLFGLQVARIIHIHRVSPDIAIDGDLRLGKWEIPGPLSLILKALFIVYVCFDNRDPLTPFSARQLLFKALRHRTTRHTSRLSSKCLNVQPHTFGFQGNLYPPPAPARGEVNRTALPLSLPSTLVPHAPDANSPGRSVCGYSWLCQSWVHRAARGARDSNSICRISFGSVQLSY